ncbi:MAG: hypothetical protein CVU00_13405 [Bacteroidetes bacterium HGW-Bacteroidetes-17]|jgi:uncharacterized protein (UPF0248 family)|nr:MAG: hypothetical protein CVU00_13405 [Bacteroidetes bacterium HGW-Bacteroidetes-17]
MTWILIVVVVFGPLILALVSSRNEKAKEATRIAQQKEQEEAGSELLENAPIGVRAWLTSNPSIRVDIITSIATLGAAKISALTAAQQTYKQSDGNPGLAAFSVDDLNSIHMDLKFSPVVIREAYIISLVTGDIYTSQQQLINAIINLRPKPFPSMSPLEDICRMYNALIRLKWKPTNEPERTLNSILHHKTDYPGHTVSVYFEEVYKDIMGYTLIPENEQPFYRVVEDVSMADIIIAISNVSISTSGAYTDGSTFIQHICKIQCHDSKGVILAKRVLEVKPPEKLYRRLHEVRHDVHLKPTPSAIISELKEVLRVGWDYVMYERWQQDKSSSEAKITPDQAL